MPAMGQDVADSLTIQADSVFLHERSQTTGKVCAGKIGADSSVSKPGVCAQARSVPGIVAPSAVSQNFEVSWDARTVLDTGEHGDVVVRSGAKLRLKPGHYRLRSLTLEWDARLELDSVLAGDSGMVRVEVSGVVHLMDRVATSLGTVMNDDALAQVAGRLSVVAGSVQIDNDLKLAGRWNTVGNVGLGDRTRLLGSLSGAVVVIGYDARLSFAATGSTAPALPVVRILAPVAGLETNATSLPVSWSVDGAVRNDVEALGPEGRQLVRRCVGNVCAEVAVTVDRTAPVVRITSPADGALLNRTPLPLVWSVDGVMMTESVNLSEGTNILMRQSLDAAGNRGTASVSVTLDTHVPVVRILAPSDGFLTNKPSQTVRWSIDGVEQTPNGIELTEGSNVVSRSVTTAAGNTGSASISVRLDTKAPVVSILSPADGDTVKTAMTPLRWSVDGVVFNDSASLVLGRNVLAREASDSAGNLGGTSVTVYRILPFVPPPDTVIVVPPAGVDTVPAAPIAPAFPASGVLPFGDQVSFLWSGTGAVIQGLQPGALDTGRVVVIRGKVLDTKNAPLPGVRVEIADHPELGHTWSRADGQYDLVANGGVDVWVGFRKAGYLPVERRAMPGWKEYAVLDSVSMTALDAKITVVNFGTSEAATVVGTTTSDERGSRAVSVSFPAGSHASLEGADGTLTPVTSLTFRATEYTVGATGRQAMPCDLPTTSAYTYAVEIGADEAIASGASHIRLDRPAAIHLDNFLGMPVGIPVPNGSLNRKAHRWEAEKSGLVIGVLAVHDGLATLSLDSTGAAATQAQLDSLGITSDELRIIGARFGAGSSFWRVQVTHFTTYDFNFGYGWPNGAIAPDASINDLNDKSPTDCKIASPGCVLDVEEQRLGEDFSIPGSGIGIHYRSDRTPEHEKNYSISFRLNVPVTHPSFRGGFVHLSVAGKDYWQSINTSSPVQTVYLRWDGRDAAE